VASYGWVVVTGDKAILRTRLEMAAIRESQALVLVVIGKKAPVGELAQNFVNTQGRIVRFVETAEPPAIAKIYRPGPRERPGSPGRVKAIPAPGLTI